MPSRPPVFLGALSLAALSLLLALLDPHAALAQRRAAKLTEDTLVPEELFPAGQGKQFGYPNGFDLVAMRQDGAHVFKLTEGTTTYPAPSPTAPPPAGEAVVAEPTPDTTPEAQPTLPPTEVEKQFLERVGLVRPTFVTLVFAESPEAARQMAQDFFDQRNDPASRPFNLAVMEIEKDKKLGTDAFRYNREFNLGERSGGVRRGSTLALARGSVFVRVDAYWGLKDGAFEAELETLETRARQMMTFLLRRL